MADVTAAILFTGLNTKRWQTSVQLLRKLRLGDSARTPASDCLTQMLAQGYVIRRHHPVNRNQSHGTPPMQWKLTALGDQMKKNLARAKPVAPIASWAGLNQHRQPTFRQYK